MRKKLSKTEKLHIEKQISACMNQVESSILSMILLIDETTDKRRILKLKQALLSLKVEYNRIKIQYKNEAD